jgi:hypothetical protein
VGNWNKDTIYTIFLEQPAFSLRRGSDQFIKENWPKTDTIYTIILLSIELMGTSIPLMDSSFPFQLLNFFVFSPRYVSIQHLCVSNSVSKYPNK